MTGEWVAVGEGLPEDHRLVLVATRLYPAVAGLGKDGQWYTIFGALVGGTVTHWMELPAAPGEGER